MSKRKKKGQSNRPTPGAAAAWAKRHRIGAGALCLAIALVMVAGTLANRRIQRSKKARTADSSLQPQVLGTASKEYIYAGSRLIATEEPTSGCSYSLNPTGNPSVPSTGGSYQVSVTAGTGCTWTAASNVAWITITSGASGTGNGTVTYTVAANTGQSSQTGTMTIAALTFTVTENGAGCTYSISPTSQTFTASGGTSSVGVTAGTGCTWTATSNASWITITSGASGSGNGTVNYTVAANTGQSTLTGTLTIASQTFTVTEAGACTYQIAPTTQNFPAAGSSSSITVTTGAACAWSGSTSTLWITLTAVQSGCGSGVCGNGTLFYSVAANGTTSARTGTITVAGQTFTVTQDAGCAFTFNPSTMNFPAGGATQSITVTTAGSNCAWSAAPVDSWITVNAPTTGTGNGTISLTVGQNPNTTSRSGSITVNTVTYTVTQDASVCGFQVTPTSINAPQAGGTFSNTLNVATGSGCAWTAASNVTWISISGGNGGPVSFTGSSAVGYTVSANTTTSTRTGTMTVAGTTVTVTQPGTCGYSLSSSSQSFPASGGTGSVNVLTQSGCAWTATSNASWITITSGSSGTGNGTVSYSVAANTTSSAQTGTLTIGGQTFTVTEAAACTYSISPTSQSFAASGGSSSVSVTAGTGCAWTAASNASWITVTSGASGSGNGTVGYSAAANTNSSTQTGTITIAGQTFTVSVAGVSCSYSISPTSQSFGSGGGTSSLSVTTTTGCSWTAVSNATWITVTSGASGSGNGTVGYSVSANTGSSSRTGTIAAAGLTFTVTQAGSGSCGAVSTFSGTGVYGYLEGNPTTAKWANPNAVATAKEPAGANAVFIADSDNSRIRMVYVDGPNAGQSVLIAGTGAAGYSPPGSDATQVNLNGPRGLAALTNSSGVVTAIFFADTGNNMIRKLTPPAGGTGPWSIADFSGTGIAGYSDGAPASAQFNAPQGVAVASNGTVYIADASNNLIRALDTGGNASTYAGGTNQGTNTPVGVALSKNTGNLFVTDQGTHSIFSFGPGGFPGTRIAGSGSSGFADATGTAAKFNSPYQLAWTTTTADGEVLYIADRLNQRLRKLVLSSNAVTTYAGSGTAGFADASCSSAQFNSPGGTGVGAVGEVYVGDAANNRIRKVQ